MKIYTIPNEIRTLSDLFCKKHFEIYLVGGCIRDLLMNEKPHDWDMCTNATPDEMKQICKEENIRYLTTGEKHGTIVFILNNSQYEITTYRVDGKYSDGRHPDSVNFTRLLKEDLARRDFTINAIAMNPETCDIIDPFHGKDDIAKLKLAAVGDANERIKEDALRMLRAMRFAIKYGMTMDDELVAAIHANVNLIHNISKERITDEFRKMFATGQPVTEYFSLFSDLITAIIPEMKPCVNFNQNNKYHKHDVYEHMLSVVDSCSKNTDKFAIQMAALFHDIGKPRSYIVGEDGYGHFYGHPDVSAEITIEALKKDFRLSRCESERILELVKYHDMDISPTEKSVRRALNKHGEEYMQDWMILKQADMDDHIYPDDTHMKTVAPLISIMNDISEENMAFSLKDLDVTGNGIMSLLNIKQGKIVGEILNKLLEEVIDGELDNTESSLKARAEMIFKERGLVDER